MRQRVAIARNLAKAWLLMLLPAAAFGFIGWEIGGYRLAFYFGTSIVLLATALYWFAERIAMGMVGARELLPGEAAGLHATVASLSARAGVTAPRLYLLPEGSPRALLAGRGARGGAALGISTGLLAFASPQEVEGIVAHELGHLRRRDVFVQTAAAVVAGAIVELTRLGGALSRSLLVVLGPIAASFVHLMLSPKREFEADRFAAGLCGSPHGLADALLRLEQGLELVAFQASPVTEPLYITNPFALEGLASLFVTHPPLGERVRRLRELDPEWREKLRAA